MIDLPYARLGNRDTSLKTKSLLNDNRNGTELDDRPYYLGENSTILHKPYYILKPVILA